MVLVTMVTLQDVHQSLRARACVDGGLPCHIAAFSAWITGDEAGLRQQAERAIAFDGQARHPEHVAALGYGAAAGVLDDAAAGTLSDEIDHLSGRDFFAPGRPLRFEADGVALLGTALGASAAGLGGAWLGNLLTKANVAAVDPWQQGLIRAARMANGETNLRIGPPDLAVALGAKGGNAPRNGDAEAAWSMAARLQPHDDGIARDAVRLAVFEFILARQAHVAIGGAGADDLKALLRNADRSLKLWQYEEKGRTSRSAPGRWEIDNEYHVQALLWTILAPVFGDLEDEENLPSIGHKHPRADLGIPSLRTIVEVKYMRAAGQRACADVIEQIAADASLYLSKAGTYDNIIAVVWDDCAQTEQHHELRTGLESIRGVSAAVILSRPAKMKRSL
jgi:hypothetical protein